MMEIDGTWKVTALGWAKVMNILGDRKVIKDGEGHNVIFGKKWGYFKVESTSPEYLTLNYDDARNPAWMRRIKDHVRQEDEGWIGSLFQNGEEKFQFRLERD